MELSAELAETPFKESLVHQAVTAYMAGGRAGTKAQKNRAAVSGGGRKPWRQKGTGRARAGTTRGPIWRSGGVTFAAVPRDHSQKLNKKMYRAAMRSIVAELDRQERIAVVAKLAIKEPKTKLLVAELTKQKAEGRILLIVAEVDENLSLAARNIPYVEVRTANSLDPVVLVGADKVIATKDALAKIEEQLA